jgi:hypothetical protein
VRVRIYETLYLAVSVVVSLVSVCVWARSQTTPSGTVSGCSLTGQGRFAIGTTQTATSFYYGRDHYRCLPILDADLKPIGAAWVKVEADGTVGLALPK